MSDEKLGKIEERVAQTATRGEVAELRKEINESFAELRSEMVGGLAEMRSIFDRRFEKVEEQCERLNHVLLAGAIAIVVALIGVIGALLVS